MPSSTYKSISDILIMATDYAESKRHVTYDDFKAMADRIFSTLDIQQDKEDWLKTHLADIILTLESGLIKEGLDDLKKLLRDLKND